MDNPVLDSRRELAAEVAFLVGPIRIPFLLWLLYDKKGIPAGAIENITSVARPVRLYNQQDQVNV